MANPVIDLRRLKNALKGSLAPERELPVPTEEPLLETEAAAHPGGFAAGPAGQVLIEWSAQEFNYDAASVTALLLIGAALGVGSLIAAFFKNFLFAAFLLIAGGLVTAYAFRPPRERHFALTSRGLAIGERLYEFDDLESFWIFYDPPLMKDLALRSKKALMPIIRMPIGDTDPLRLREILLRFLREEEQEMGLTDIISKHLGLQ